MIHNHHCLLISFEFPPYPGGIGTYSYQIAHRFHDIGAPVLVATKHSDHAYQDMRDFDQTQPFPIFRFRTQNLPALKALDRTWETLRLCRQYNVQWIHCCSYNAAFVAFVCKTFLGIPYFLMGHGSEYTKPSSTRKIILQQALGTFANSHYTAGLMQPYTAKPVTVTSLGADTHEYDPAQVHPADVDRVRRQYALYGNPLLLSVGRLNPRKGHHVTLEALTAVRVVYPNVQLIIVGRNVDGADEYEAVLRRYVAETNLSQNVCFIQTAPLSELKILYALADLFVLSSIEHQGDVEGFGIVLIEANLMGKPVVAANSGGIPDAVEDGKSGYLYQSGDARDLTTKLLSLLGNSSQSLEMGRYGRQRALNSFNWRSVAAKTWSAIVQTYPPAAGLISLVQQPTLDS